MIKLIVSDLDGTLFDETHQLHAVSAEAIQQANAAGIQFMVATGRAKENVLPYFEKANIKCSKIVLNGAMFLDQDNEIKYSVPIHHDDVRTVFHLMESHGVVVHIFYLGGIACTDPEKMVRDFKQRIKEKENLSDEEIDEMIEHNGFCDYDLKIDDLDEFLKEHPMIFKMEAFANDEVVIQEVRDKLRAMDHLDISNSVADNIEVTNVQAQKGWTLQHICEIMNIDKKEVVTIGDSMNDVSMIRDFPNSYAMENACDEIKKLAAYQTGSNRDHGVAQVIYKVLEKQGR